MIRDYKVIDMPSMLARNVLKKSPDEGDVWVRDESWYEQIREIYGNLLKFFQDNNLLTTRNEHSSVDSVVVMFSDLKKDGQALIESGADEKWLTSFDRPGSVKSPTDVSILTKALEKVRKTPAAK